MAISFKFYSGEKMTSIGIVGSRTIKDYCLIKNIVILALKQFNLSFDNIVLVSGGAIGVDSLAQQFAKEFGLTIIIYYPDWKRYGKRAALLRNTKIVESSNIVIAFVNEKSCGTWDTINKARKQNKKVIIYDVDKKEFL